MYFALNGEGYCRSNNGQENKHNDACSFFEPKPITNGDKIRQMSNDELAVMLSDVNFLTMIFDLCPGKECSCVETCKDSVFGWLNAPAESEGKDE